MYNSSHTFIHRTQQCKYLSHTVIIQIKSCLNIYNFNLMQAVWNVMNVSVKNSKK